MCGYVSVEKDGVLEAYTARGNKIIFAPSCRGLYDLWHLFKTLGANSSFVEYSDSQCRSRTCFHVRGNTSLSLFLCTRI